MKPLRMLFGPARYSAPALFLLAAFAGPPHSVASEGEAALGAAEEVSALIEQLGAPKYVVRESARRKLQGMGLVAFDQLLVAAEHADPEVAAASERLLETMTVRWSRPSDPPSVRRLLQTYGQQAERERRQVGRDLARLRSEAGVAALCRIARFDPSERLSREAAVRVMEPVSSFSWSREQALATRGYAFSESRRDALLAAIEDLSAEFGASRRTAGRWLSLVAEQAESPAGTIDRWRQAVETEARAIDQRRPFTDEVIVDALRWNLFRSQLASGEEDGLMETIDTLTSAQATSETALKKALEWMVEAGADAGVDALLGSERQRFTTKEGLYLAASIREKQGREEQAEALAQQAFEVEPPETEGLRIGGAVALKPRVLAGLRLDGKGYAEWARREYRAAIGQAAELTINTAYTRWVLANSLMDHEQYEEAAQHLTASLDAIDQDDRTRIRYRHLGEQFERLQPAKVLAARRDYLRASAARDAGDSAGEIEHLKSAIGNDPTDADILIAMHRAAGADEAFHAETLERIARLSEETQQRIDEDPDDALQYNQWAWLISNTVGDYAKAIRYSEKSLELAPGDSGFLDTLGRCYFAIGDLERAVATQREAVRGQPHLQVMRRQLNQFEAALNQSRSDSPSQESAPGEEPTDS